MIYPTMPPPHDDIQRHASSKLMVDQSRRGTPSQRALVQVVWRYKLVAGRG